MVCDAAHQTIIWKEWSSLLKSDTITRSRQVLCADSNRATHRTWSELLESICATLSQNETKKSKFRCFSEAFNTQESWRVHAGYKGNHLHTKLQGINGTKIEQNASIRILHKLSSLQRSKRKISEMNEINTLSFLETSLPCKSDVQTQAAFPRQKNVHVSANSEIPSIYCALCSLSINPWPPPLNIASLVSVQLRLWGWIF